MKVLSEQVDFQYDLYLLNKLDTPWEEDDLRDRPEQRLEMFTAFEKSLKDTRKLQHEYVTLEHLLFAMLCSENFLKLITGYLNFID